MLKTFGLLALCAASVIGLSTVSGAATSPVTSTVSCCCGDDCTCESCDCSCDGKCGDDCNCGCEGCGSSCDAD